jgi:hypothetical protein
LNVELAIKGLELMSEDDRDEFIVGAAKKWGAPVAVKWLTGAISKVMTTFYGRYATSWFMKPVILFLIAHGVTAEKSGSYALGTVELSISLLAAYLDHRHSKATYQKALNATPPESK